MRATVLTNSRRGEMGEKGGDEQSRKQLMRGVEKRRKMSGGRIWPRSFRAGCVYLGQAALIFALYILMTKRIKASFLPPLSLHSAFLH